MEKCVKRGQTANDGGFNADPEKINCLCGAQGTDYTKLNTVSSVKFPAQSRRYPAEVVFLSSLGFLWFGDTSGLFRESFRVLAAKQENQSTNGPSAASGRSQHFHHEGTKGTKKREGKKSSANMIPPAFKAGPN